MSTSVNGGGLGGGGAAAGGRMYKEDFSSH